LKKGLEATYPTFDYKKPPTPKFEFDVTDEAGSVRHVLARVASDSSVSEEEDDSSDDEAPQLTTEVEDDPEFP
jgi:hypothetical protein